MDTATTKNDGNVHRSFNKVLVIDVGGTNVKILATGKRTPRKVASGPTMTARTWWKRSDGSPTLARGQR
ncbi:MAG: hypothetical protein OJF51_001403 [Nitrospira sp.]|jgi:hypothetical protein|nr:MAG: hypothetical protein OJF51_001403 [Nitrospira sp.]